MTKHPIVVGQAKDGKFFATSHVEPIFFLIDDTEAAVLALAREALEVYAKLKSAARPAFTREQPALIGANRRVRRMEIEIPVAA